MNRTTVISAQKLTKKFGDFTAVDQVDFEVYQGEIFGFLGPNGSGKTTSIRMMLGLLPPTSGQVQVLGIDLEGAGKLLRRRIGYMSQKFSLYNDLTVMQNLKFYGKAYGLSNQLLSERISHGMALAGLQGKANLLTRELAGGWRQRLALSAAILHRPEVLFLDEPTAGVDPVSRRAFWDLLYQLVGEGITVFVTTHYMDEAEHCHRLAFIQHGRIIAYGAPEEIKQSTLAGQILELTPRDPAAVLLHLRRLKETKQLDLAGVELYGASIHVYAPGIRNLSRVVYKQLHRSGLDPGPMDMIDPSLEDVFIACMQ